MNTEEREWIRGIFKASMENCMDCEYYHNEDCCNKDGLCTRNSELVEQIISMFDGYRKIDPSKIRALSSREIWGLFDMKDKSKLTPELYKEFMMMLQVVSQATADNIRKDLGL